MWKLRLSKRVIFLSALILSVLIVSSYALQSATISLEIKEPLEILSYPSELSVFPGQTTNFTVTVKNSAPVVYGITLNFGLNDTAYQTRYVTFSKTVYTINQGETELEAWLTVLNSAPAAHLTLTVNLNRDQRVPDDTTVSNASLTMLLFGGGARWAAGNGTSALYVNWFDNYNIHYFTDSAKWNTTWWPREDLEKMKQNTITELSCRDFNVECVGDIPPDISKYDLVIFEAWWAVEPRHSQLVREYLINGGNVVVF